MRTHHWLIEGVADDDALVRARLACIDAQDETLQLMWIDQVDVSILADSHFLLLENRGTDESTDKENVKSARPK